MADWRAGAVEPSESGAIVSLPTLLLLDDDRVEAEAIGTLLRCSYRVVIRQQRRAALALARGVDIEVSVVVSHPPTRHGPSIVAGMRAAGVAIPLLMIGPDSDTVVGLDAGADTFLRAPFHPDELLARLRAIRRSYLPHVMHDGSAIRIGSWFLYPARHEVDSPYDGSHPLGPREVALLRMLALHPRRTFSREQILRSALAGVRHPATVDSYVHDVRSKTDGDMILTVRRTGYRIGAP